MRESRLAGAKSERSAGRHVIDETITRRVANEEKLLSVRTTAEHFARLDEANKLGELFGPPKGTAADVVLDAEREEGWILGAGA